MLAACMRSQILGNCSMQETKTGREETKDQTFSRPLIREVGVCLFREITLDLPPTPLHDLRKIGTSRARHWIRYEDSAILSGNRVVNI